MDEPEWVLKSVVLALHDEQLAEHGGRVGLRDEGLSIQHLLGQKMHSLLPPKRISRRSQRPTP
jgi:hypothetical protein